MRKVHLIGLMALICVLSLGITAAIKTVQAQVINANANLVIVDANGNTLGPVLGPVGYIASSAFYTDPFVIPVTVRKSRINGDFRAWFESNNCTGNPVLDTEEVTGIPFDAQLVTPATVYMANSNALGKVYVADPNDTPHTVTIHSIASDPTGCIENENFQAMVVDTLEFMNLDALFTPPFKATVVSEPRKGKGPKK